MDSDRIVSLVGDPLDIFGAHSHRELAETLTEMWLAQVDIDFATVGEAMQKAGRTRLLGSDLADMANISRTMNFDGDLQLLRDARLRRKVLAVLAQGRQNLVEGLADPKEVSSQTVADLVSLAAPAEGRLWELWPLVNQAIIEAESGRMPDVISTGFGQLDALLGGGLRRQTLTVVAGRPSMGKSAFSLQIALHAARAKREVLFFTVEMSGKALANRIIAGEVGKEPVKLRLAPGKADWTRIRREVAHLQEITLWIDDDPALTSAHAAAVARELKARHGLDLVVVDYLGRLADVLQANMNRNQQLGQITRAFAILGRQLDCAVVLVSQLNRRPESTADRRPSLADLRDSGEVEQDADNVLLLYRPAYYDKPDTDAPQTEAEIMKREVRKHKAELIVAKQREGPTLSLPLYWDGEHVRFRSVANVTQVEERKEQTTCIQ